jgi:hypothetical protein
MLIAALSGMLLATGTPPGIELLGTSRIPGDAKDLSGLTDTLSEGTPHNRLGSFGSGIAYTGSGHRYIAINDRGPADGASEFIARFQTLDVAVSTTGVETTLVSTTVLTRPSGAPLVGSLNGPRRLRYDAEAVRVSPSGTLWIAEEYGPRIDEFAADGRLIRSLDIPARYRGQRHTHDPKLELPPHVSQGRQPNRGFEGLAISPDGAVLTAILQGPLIQDGAVNQSGKRVGVNVRVLQIDTRTGAARDFVYVMEGPDRGVSEILAINDHEFLVLERDGKAGAAAKHRAIYHINTLGATDVSEVLSLPARDLPENIVPSQKRLFLDLTDPRFDLAGPSMPEKIEGLAFGPDLPDGRHVLLVAVDNDMVPAVPNTIWAFGIEASLLPGLRRQSLQPQARTESP